jgi:hypothetical protein
VIEYEAGLKETRETGREYADDDASHHVEMYKRLERVHWKGQR